MRGQRQKRTFGGSHTRAETGVPVGNGGGRRAGVTVEGGGGEVADAIYALHACRFSHQRSTRLAAFSL